MLKTKIISDLEKVFIGGDYDDYPAIETISALRGERVAFQVLFTLILSDDGNFSRHYRPSLTGILADFATVREVKSVPAINNGRYLTDEDYLSVKPGLFPDILAPLSYFGMAVATPYCLSSLWIELEIPEDYSGDLESSLTVTLTPDSAPGDDWGHDPVSASVKVEIIDACLPKPELIFTQWFHADCLASYYRVEKWSKEHFEIIENFVRTAVRNGINMLLTPLITPPLDNKYDTRALQLVGVTVTDGGYSFDWTHLEKWISICDRAGIKYFEIGHLFTQGGAEFATKVMGNVNGEYRRLFEKDTTCDDPGYVHFIREMLTSFLGYMKRRGDDRRCFFHISDEPGGEQLSSYLRAKSAVEDLLEGYVIMDALSDYRYYASGAVKKPVVILHKLDEFAEGGVKGLWTYNCCEPSNGHSNRFIAMTSSRNRSVSLLFYKFNIEGFLHWGYNFYYNAGSADTVNPFLDTSSGGIFPSGDAFSVYPGQNGHPIESIRLATFFSGIQDLSAIRLCESMYSRREVLSAIEELLGESIKANTYINTPSELQRIRDLINGMIKARL